MKYDKNIVTKMKSTPEFKKIDNEDLLVEEFNLDIARKFTEIKNINELLELINSVNKDIYKKSKSIKIQYLLYHAYHNKNRYSHFYISKKSGGQRTISAPTKALKNIQTTLNYILSCVYKPQMPVHGFLKNRSVVTNAKHHTEKNYVYNIDLKNFFPSIHKARIEKRLQLPPFNLSDDRSEIATIISRLTTQKVIEYTDSLTGKKELLLLENKKLLELPGNKKIIENFNSNDDSFKSFAVLPQGAPTSPSISNFICDRLDRRLMGLAKRFNVKYTRYADDITFSSMHNVYQDDSEFIVEMKKIIADQNFEINPKKTRLQKRGYRQEVTGVIVNDKTNVNRRYIKQLRAMLYSIEKHGIKKAQEDFEKHYKTDRGYVKKNIPDMLNVLSGKLDYLKMVKGKEDSTYLKLEDRFKVIVPSPHPPPEVTCNHNPQKLVEILKRFTINDNPFKAAVHSEDEYYKYGSYKKFMEALRKEWNSVDKELKQISKRLHGKIYGFLFNDKLEEENRGHKGWGENSIEFGWSSKELKEWCTQAGEDIRGNNPFECPLDGKFIKKVNKITIGTFWDVSMNVFKHEIEIRSEENYLWDIFVNMKSYLGSDFKVAIDDNLKGQDFYTDTHWFKSGLKIIFSEIKKRKKHSKIKIMCKKEVGYIEIKIIQLKSYLYKTHNEMLLEVNNGDFATIKEQFCSLCDWSIETKCSDGNYRINYLKPGNKKEVEKLKSKPKGFTHIIRFYT